MSRCPCNASSRVDTEGVSACDNPVPGVAWRIVKGEDRSLRALCVSRHAFLSDHLSRFFGAVGVESKQAVGLDQALTISRDFKPDVVIAEYELLATLSLEAWEQDELLSRTAVVAVSLTRRPHEAHLLDVNGIAGFLYLPLLDSATAGKIIIAAASSSRNRYTPAPAKSSPAGIDTQVAAPR